MRLAETHYAMVYFLLLLLLAVTVAVAHLPLQFWAAPLALVIASLKAGLVMVYFMHLRYSPKLTWIAALGALVWLLILLAGVMADYVARGFRL